MPTPSSQPSKAATKLEKDTPMASPDADMSDGDDSSIQSGDEDAHSNSARTKGKAVDSSGETVSMPLQKRRRVTRACDECRSMSPLAIRHPYTSPTRTAAPVRVLFSPLLRLESQLNHLQLLTPLGSTADRTLTGKKIKCDGKQPCTHCQVYSYGMNLFPRLVPAPRIHVDLCVSRLHLRQAL